MAELQFKPTNDVLFKMIFVQHTELLRRTVARMLNIADENIGKFEIRNTEMPPEEVGKKFCRLDINMTVGGRLVDLEVQVKDEHDYPGAVAIPLGAGVFVLAPCGGRRGVH
jgi:hypothetical protein